MADVKSISKTGIVEKNSKNELLAQLEKKVAVILRTSSNKLIYDTFDNNLQTYLLKIPNSNCKKIVSNLLTDKRIYIVSNISKSKNGVYGVVLLSSADKVGGVGLEATNLNIDIKTGETPDIDNCVYCAYQQYIRAGVYTQYNSLKADWELHKLVLQYLQLVYMRAIGGSTSFNDKRKNLLKLVLYYFYIRFGLNKDHPLAIERAYQQTDLEDLYKEFKQQFDLFKRYTSFNDIFKAIKDLGIVGTTSVSTMMLDTVKKYTIGGYYAITSTLDMFISTAVATLYPLRYLTNLQVNANLQKKIENKALAYCKKIKFDKYK